MVQEFVFGIPVIGEVHKAELGVEIWYAMNGNVTEIKVVQKTDVIDIDTIKVIHSKSKCQSSDIVERCDTTHLSMKFLGTYGDAMINYLRPVGSDQVLDIAAGTAAAVGRSESGSTRSR